LRGTAKNAWHRRLKRIAARSRKNAPIIPLLHQAMPFGPCGKRGSALALALVRLATLPLPIGHIAGVEMPACVEQLEVPLVLEKLTQAQRAAA